MVNSDGDENNFAIKAIGVIFIIVLIWLACIFKMAYGV